MNGRMGGHKPHRLGVTHIDDKGQAGEHGHGDNPQSDVALADDLAACGVPCPVDVDQTEVGNKQSAETDSASFLGVNAGVI